MHRSLLAFIASCLLMRIAFAARPHDEIRLESFNKTFLIADEVYEFELVPTFQVPLNLKRHIIYTGTREALKRHLKRALFDNPADIQKISEEDYTRIASFMNSTLPPHVRIDTFKRSLPVKAGSPWKRVVLSPRLTVTHTAKDVRSRKKRSIEGDGIWGGTLCIHVPFFTTCDNSADIEGVKESIQAATDSLREEIDWYRSANDARMTALVGGMKKQQDLIGQITSNLADTTKALFSVIGTVTTNAAVTMDGDYILHAQMDSLQRVSNSLLRHSNALASTDPRSVATQPSISRLFDGYMNQMEVIRAQKRIPIVSTRTFDWTEQILPENAVKTVVISPGLFITSGFGAIRGFRAAISSRCAETCASDSTQCCSSFVDYEGELCEHAWSLLIEIAWFYGPFHTDHVGIYPVPPTNTVTIKPVVPPQVQYNGAFTASFTGTSPSCVSFLGYKVLASFDTTPGMLNGVSTAMHPLSECNNYRLKHRSPDSSDNFILFVLKEGVTIPFYSNCNKSSLQPLTSAKVGWLSKYPNTALDTDGSSSTDFTTYDVNARHFVSAGCYVNLEPEWLGMKYWVNDTTLTINSIPYGYKMNQFTVNPEGELSSALEFLYTDKWVQVYSILRKSTNNVIVDEVDVLNGDQVLFHLNNGQNSIVDESDAFFGESNNGRDCVRKADNYEYDLLSCLYQNDQTAYTADQYLTGLVSTTGIARFNSKFDFALQSATVNGLPSYAFTLKPKISVDFNFYVELDGQVCPKLIGRQVELDHCEFLFYFTGQGSVLFGAESVSFNGNVANVSVPFGYHELTVNGVECLIVQCLYTSEVATIRLETPNVEIISQDDLNLNAKVAFSFNQTMGSALSELTDKMTGLQNNIDRSLVNLTKITEALEDIDFDILNFIPEKNFTELRKKVDDLIKKIGEGGKGGSSAAGGFGEGDCEGAFASIENMASTLITIAIVVGVIVLVYVILFKCGLLQRMKKSCGGKKKKKFAVENAAYQSSSAATP